MATAARAPVTSHDTSCWVRQRLHASRLNPTQRKGKKQVWASICASSHGRNRQWWHGRSTGGCWGPVFGGRRLDGRRRRLPHGLLGHGWPGGWACARIPDIRDGVYRIVSIKIPDSSDSDEYLSSEFDPISEKAYPVLTPNSDKILGYPFLRSEFAPKDFGWTDGREPFTPFAPLVSRKCWHIFGEEKKGAPNVMLCQLGNSTLEIIGITLRTSN